MKIDRVSEPWKGMREPRAKSAGLRLAVPDGRNRGEEMGFVAGKLAHFSRAPRKTRRVYSLLVDAVLRLEHLTSVARNVMSFAEPLGTARPPMRGSLGTFQSYPDPSAMRPWG